MDAGKIEERDANVRPGCGRGHLRIVIRNREGQDAPWAGRHDRRTGGKPRSPVLGSQSAHFLCDEARAAPALGRRDRDRDRSLRRDTILAPPAGRLRGSFVDSTTSWSPRTDQMSRPRSRPSGLSGRTDAASDSYSSRVPHGFARNRDGRGGSSFPARIQLARRSRSAGTGRRPQAATGSIPATPREGAKQCRRPSIPRG